MMLILQISPLGSSNRQSSVSNMLARTSSSGSASSVAGSPHPSLGSASSNRQSSQSSLFEQFATQAKELVKETKRQSSQDGLLAQVDKVSNDFHIYLNDVCVFVRNFIKIICIPIGIMCMFCVLSYYPSILCIFIPDMTMMFRCTV